jgi:hypothetical protein
MKSDEAGHRSLHNSTDLDDHSFKDNRDPVMSFFLGRRNGTNRCLKVTSFIQVILEH